MCNRTGRHGFNSDLPRQTEQLTGSALLAAYNEELQLAVEKLQNGDISKAEFIDIQAELQVKAQGLNQTEIKTRFDDAVAAGILLAQNQHAVVAMRNSLHLCGRLITDVNDITAPPSHEISNKELFSLMATAGRIDSRNFQDLMNVTSSDIDSAEMLTDPSVHYVIKPLSLINIFPRVGISTMDIRELRVDTTKEIGVPANFKTVAETVAFSEVKLGTKDVTRKLYSFGAFWKMYEEWLNDSNRAHFLPYAVVRLREEFMLQLELIILNGSDEPAANTVIGFAEETGIQTRAAKLAAGAWTKSHINAFATAIAAIATSSSAYGQAQWIVLHPNDYSLLLQSWEDNVGYLFAPPAGVAGGPPVGQDIPTLFGVPIAQSQAVTEGDFWVVDWSDSAAYFNGGEYATQEGLVADDLTKRAKSLVMKTRMTQLTRFPAKIYRIQQTQ